MVEVTVDVDFDRWLAEIEDPVEREAEAVRLAKKLEIPHESVLSAGYVKEQFLAGRYSQDMAAKTLVVSEGIPFSEAYKKVGTWIV